MEVDHYHCTSTFIINIGDWMHTHRSVISGDTVNSGKWGTETSCREAASGDGRLVDQFWLDGMKLDRDKERMNGMSGLAVRSSTMMQTGKRQVGDSNRTATSLSARLGKLVHKQDTSGYISMEQCSCHRSRSARKNV
ncbi:hypothetical protein ZIOFF_053217 [Zingiber officinale]|uniref:Uncharacterized protein n=1 Tax=Zingiber officinale TaxID=94328 RepID=A0A8J5FD56_ZINOF|nr:hypothetical protein ZIOFF_053217 [Zingiber officinale]